MYAREMGFLIALRKFDDVIERAYDRIVGMGFADNPDMAGMNNAGFLTPTQPIRMPPIAAGGGLPHPARYAFA